MVRNLGERQHNVPTMTLNRAQRQVFSDQAEDEHVHRKTDFFWEHSNNRNVGLREGSFQLQLYPHKEICYFCRCDTHGHGEPGLNRFQCWRLEF